MERALAVLIGGMGVVMLTLFAVATAGSEPATVQRPQVDIEVFSTRPLPPEALDVVEARTTDTSKATAGPVAAAPLVTTTVARAAPAAAPPTAPVPVPASLVALVAEIDGGGIRFAFARYELDPRGAALLDRLVTELAARPDLGIVVTGHTDSIGPDDVNAELSRQRAQVVTDYLAARGIAAARLRFTGMGPVEPVADNATAEGRQANRRSEVSVEGGGR